MSSISSVSELNQLSGLDAAKRTLRGLFERRSPVHAILFYGDEGAGKRTLARFVAQYWLCTNPSVEGPCQECRACRAFLKGGTPDLLVVRPWGPSSLIKLSAIHFVSPPQDDDPPIKIVDFLRTLPIQARTKVILIESAERMNGDVARALLKTLEEPGEHARFVLTTAEIGRVEPTIRSRCMAVPCELPASEGARELWEAALSRRSPGLLQRMRANPEVYREIFLFAQELSELPLSGCLAASERFRRLAERLQKAEESNARSAGAVAVPRDTPAPSAPRAAGVRARVLKRRGLCASHSRDAGGEARPAQRGSRCRSQS